VHKTRGARGARQRKPRKEEAKREHDRKLCFIQGRTNRDPIGKRRIRERIEGIMQEWMYSSKKGGGLWERLSRSPSAAKNGVLKNGNRRIPVQGPSEKKAQS